MLAAKIAVGGGSAPVYSQSLRAASPNNSKNMQISSSLVPSRMIWVLISLSLCSYCAPSISIPIENITCWIVLKELLISSTDGTGVPCSPTGFSSSRDIESMTAWNQAYLSVEKRRTSCSFLSCSADWLSEETTDQAFLASFKENWWPFRNLTFNYVWRLSN